MRVLSTILVLSAFCLLGCQQVITRQYGGEMSFKLGECEKLEMVTWKAGDIWFLTRPMREGEEPETHVFRESSTYGVFEGVVTILEQCDRE